MKGKINQYLINMIFLEKKKLRRGKGKWEGDYNVGISYYIPKKAAYLWILCTYNLYDKQVNVASACRTVHQPFFRLNSLNRNVDSFQIQVRNLHLIVIALSIPYWSFIVSELTKQSGSLGSQLLSY